MTLITSEIFTCFGNDYQRQGDFVKAQACYEKAISLDPNHLPALANLATVLSAQNKLVAATAILHRVTSQTPNDPDQWLALGNVLMRRNKLVGCMPALCRALELRPENPDVHVNLAAVEYRRRNYEKAEELLNHVLSLGQTHHSTYFDLSHVKLGQGDLEAGLGLYEYRWHTMVHGPAWDHHIPEWTGEDLTKKHILIHAEQGFGDTIMLSRFISWIRAKKVTFAVPGTLVMLFKAQTLGNEVSVIDLENLPLNASRVYDFHTPMFSMLRWLGATKQDINSKPYLFAPDDGPTVSKTNKFKVGICWASGSHGDKQANWRRRVTDLETWLPLAEIPDVQLFSLQRDTGTKDIADIGAGGLIVDLMPEVDDWSDTAKLINQLDLVISVDTGVVHLAGALGKPVWMLSQQSPCWRWWNIENGNGLPWYSDFKIFWNQGPNNWSEMLDDCWVKLTKDTSYSQPSSEEN
jgi:hypothetical protein